MSQLEKDNTPQSESRLASVGVAVLEKAITVGLPLAAAWALLSFGDRARDSISERYSPAQDWEKSSFNITTTNSRAEILQNMVLSSLLIHLENGPATKEISDTVSSGGLKIIFEKLNYPTDSKSRVAAVAPCDGVMKINSEGIVPIIELIFQTTGNLAQACDAMAFFLLPTVVHEYAHFRLDQKLQAEFGEKFSSPTLESEVFAYAAEAKYCQQFWNAELRQKDLMILHAECLATKAIPNSGNILKVYQEGPDRFSEYIQSIYAFNVPASLSNESRDQYRNEMTKTLIQCLKQGDIWLDLMRNPIGEETAWVAEYVVQYKQMQADLGLLQDPIRFNSVADFLRLQAALACQTNSDIVGFTNKWEPFKL